MIASLRYQTGFVGFVQQLFGFDCVTCGLPHFAYAEITASMIPGWMPAHLILAYVTGAGHLAAGLGILTGVLPRLAATLEALMLSSFLLQVHMPNIFANPPHEGGTDDAPAMDNTGHRHGAGRIPPGYWRAPNVSQPEARNLLIRYLGEILCSTANLRSSMAMVRYSSLSSLALSAGTPSSLISRLRV